MARLLGYLSALGLTLATAAPSWAHALGVQCKYIGGSVEVEAYYDDDTPAKRAKVTVVDSGGAVVAKGRTDAHGRWSFMPAKWERYEVIVDAGGGHAARVGINVMRGVISSQVPVEISEGPSREEFTRFPWLKVAIGLGAIGAFSLGLWLARSSQKRKTSSA